MIRPLVMPPTVVSLAFEESDGTNERRLILTTGASDYRWKSVSQTPLRLASVGGTGGGHSRQNHMGALYCP